MAIKESLKNVAADLGDLYNMQRIDLLPRFGELRDKMSENFYNQITPYTDTFRGMATDESKQGYSPETLNAMRANATGAIAGQKASTMENVNKNIAASGMGNTAMATHMARRIGKDTMTAQREANRDVDLAGAEAKRQDKWNAAQFWGQGLAQTSNYYDQMMRANAGQLATYGSMQNTLGSKIPALTGASNVSFWGANPLSQMLVGAML